MHAAAADRPPTAARSAHSPPKDGHAQANARREHVTCGHCQRTNTGRQDYCAECGRPLYEHCPACDMLILATEAHCGGCGLCVVDHMASQAARCEELLAEAAHLRQAFRFDDALATLGRMPESRHSALASFVERGNSLVQTYIADRDRIADEARDSLAAARAAIERQEHGSAQRMLESIPETLRSREALDLLATTRAWSDEVATLTECIQHLTRANTTEGLLPKVERLLALRPEDAEARQLRDDLLRRQASLDKRRAGEIMLETRRLLDEHRYEEAHRRLLEIAESALTEEIVKWKEQVGELDWLHRTLRAAPMVEPLLVKIGQRFAELRPNDPRGAELLAQLRDREGKPPARGHCDFPAWSQPPKATPLGMPVDWAGRFRRLRPANQEVAQLLSEHSGRFWTAAGLALSALRRAAVDIDFRPDQAKSGLLSRLTWSKQPSASAWGIDIGKSTVKALKLTWKDDHFVVDSVDIISMETGDADDDNCFPSGGTLTKALGTLPAKLVGNKDRVCIGVPGAKTLGRFFSLPRLSGAKLDKAVAYEAKLQMPLGLDQLAWDYAVFDPSDVAGTGANTIQAVLLATRASELQSFLASIEAAGVRVDCVGSEFSALYNAAAWELFSTGEEPLDESRTSAANGPTLAIVDVGAAATNLVVGSPSRLWFRSFKLGSDDFRGALTQRFKLTRSQAGKVLSDISLARSLRKIDEAFDPLFARLAGEITRSLAACATSNPELKIDRLLLTGGGGRTAGLLRYLRSGSLILPS